MYKETRNGMVGADYSSKFSPWLAHGCLSPRYIYQEVRRYEKERYHIWNWFPYVINSQNLDALVVVAKFLLNLLELRAPTRIG